MIDVWKIKLIMVNNVPFCGMWTKKSVTYGSGSSRGFNQRLEHLFWGVSRYYSKEAYIFEYEYKYHGIKER